MSISLHISLRSDNCHAMYSLPNVLRLIACFDCQGWSSYQTKIVPTNQLSQINFIDACLRASGVDQMVNKFDQKNKLFQNGTEHKFCYLNSHNVLCEANLLVDFYRNLPLQLFCLKPNP